MKYKGGIYLFTDSFPYGTSENFLETEIHYLANDFEWIYIFPRRYNRSKTARPVPQNVKTALPFCSSDKRSRLAVQGFLNTSPILPFLKDFPWNVCWKIRPVVKWVEAFLLSRLILNHPHSKKIQSADSSTLLYFYWGCGTAWALPFISSKAPAIARFHGFDLYEDEQGNGGYIPLRQQLLNRLDAVFTISQHGQNYLSKLYPHAAGNILLSRLGVQDKGSTPRPENNTPCHIVSCSRMIPLKRLHLLVAALQSCTMQIRWTHIGDGPLRQSIEEKTKKLPVNVQFACTGMLPSDEVTFFYNSHAVDLFINISETEGLSVAIMEALAAGIPVIATDVGGTSELIDRQVGELIPKDFSPQALAKLIDSCATRTTEWQQRSECARIRWKERVCADTNYASFSKELQKIAGGCR